MRVEQIGIDRKYRHGRAVVSERGWEVTVIDVLKVSSKSNPNSVAGALAGVVRTNGSVEIQVVGAGALNQAVKALAIARGYMATSGQDLVCRPTFADIKIDGESRTAIRLQIEACPMSPLNPSVDGNHTASDQSL